MITLEDPAIKELVELIKKDKYKEIYDEWMSLLSKDVSVNGTASSVSIKKHWFHYCLNDIMPEKKIDELINKGGSMEDIVKDSQYYFEQSIRDRFKKFNNVDDNNVKKKLQLNLFRQTKKDNDFIKNKMEECKKNIKKLTDILFKMKIKNEVLNINEEDKLYIFENNKILSYDDKNDSSLSVYVASIILGKSIDKSPDYQALMNNYSDYLGSVHNILRNIQTSGSCDPKNMPTLIRYWYLWYLIITNLFTSKNDLSIFNNIKRFDRTIKDIISKNEVNKKSKTNNKSGKTNKRGKTNKNVKANFIKEFQTGGKSKKTTTSSSSTTSSQTDKKLFYYTGDAKKIKEFLNKTRATIFNKNIYKLLFESISKEYIEYIKKSLIETRNSSTGSPPMGSSSTGSSNSKFNISKMKNVINLFNCDNYNKRIEQIYRYEQKRIVAEHKGKINEAISRKMFEGLFSNITEFFPFMSIDIYSGSTKESNIDDILEDILKYIIEFLIFLYIEKYKLYSSYIKTIAEININQYNIKTNNKKENNKKENNKTENKKATDKPENKKVNYDNMLKKLNAEKAEINKNFGTEEWNKKQKAIKELYNKILNLKKRNSGLII